MRTASYSGVGIGILNAATPMTNDNREKTRSDRDAPSESPNLPETNAPKAKKPKTERESALIVRPRTQSGVRSWNGWTTSTNHAQSTPDSNTPMSVNVRDALVAAESAIDHGIMRLGVASPPVPE